MIQRDLVVAVVVVEEEVQWVKYRSYFRWYAMLQLKGS